VQKSLPAAVQQLLTSGRNVRQSANVRMLARCVACG